MQAYTVEIGRTPGDRELAALRWELFEFHEIEDVVSGIRPGTVTILYEGELRLEAWLRAIALLGYEARCAAGQPDAG